MLLIPLWRALMPRPTCLLCDEPAEHVQRPVCLPCEAELPWLHTPCSICAVPLPKAQLICGQCQRRKPAFDVVQAPWHYRFPLDSLIPRFKHQQQWPIGRLLATLLADHLQHAYDQGLPRPDALVPVPLAQQRQRQRGFNQAQMLAQWLAQHLTLRCEPELVKRITDTPSQQGLSAAQRRRNLRRAFIVTAPLAVAGRHLALVDDVLTTGATAQAMARVLRQAGASRVDVYCLARTPPPGHVPV